MTTLISTLFYTLFASGAPATAGDTAAGNTASTGFAVLQGVGTVFGALATIGEARARSNELKAAAAEQDFRSRDEFILGQEKQADLKRQLALTVQRQSVAFASGGVSLASSSVEQARQDAIDDAERELGKASDDALRATFARKRQARNLRVSVRNVLSTGFAGAAVPVLKFAGSVARRG